MSRPLLLSVEHEVFVEQSFVTSLSLNNWENILPRTPFCTNILINILSIGHLRLDKLNRAYLVYNFVSSALDTVVAKLRQNPLPPPAIVLKFAFEAVRERRAAKHQNKSLDLD